MSQNRKNVITSTVEFGHSKVYTEYIIRQAAMFVKIDFER